MGTELRDSRHEERKIDVAGRYVDWVGLFLRYISGLVLHLCDTSGFKIGLTRSRKSILFFISFHSERTEIFKGIVFYRLTQGL